MAAWSADASGDPSGRLTSIGVTPIQYRWNTFVLPGSDSESAYDFASPPYHHVSSNFFSLDVASFVAHAAVDSFGLFALHVLLPRLQEALHQLGAHA